MAVYYTQPFHPDGTCCGKCGPPTARCECCVGFNDAYAAYNAQTLSGCDNDKCYTESDGVSFESETFSGWCENDDCVGETLQSNYDSFDGGTALAPGMCPDNPCPTPSQSASFSGFTPSGCDNLNCADGAADPSCSGGTSLTLTNTSSSSRTATFTFWYGFRSCCLESRQFERQISDGALDSVATLTRSSSALVVQSSSVHSVTVPANSSRTATISSLGRSDGRPCDASGDAECIGVTGSLA